MKQGGPVVLEQVMIIKSFPTTHPSMCMSTLYNLCVYISQKKNVGKRLHWRLHMIQTLKLNKVGKKC